MYNILRLLLPFLSAYTHIASTVASPISPNLQLPTLSDYNGTLPTLNFYNESLISNSSTPLNISISSSKGQHVPSSFIDLQLHFGFPRHPLDHDRLGNLLWTANWLIADLLHRNGAYNNVSRHGTDRNQAFFYSRGFIDVVINHTPSHTLTWGELSDIVRGLAIWLYDAKQSYRTHFYATSQAYNERIGSGWVKEAGKSVAQS